MRHIWKLMRLGALAVLLVIALIVGARAVQAWRDPALAPWHRFKPDDAVAREIDAMDWPAWMAREDAVFAEVEAEVTAKLPERYRTPENRYFSGSPLHPANFPVDWNRSFVMEPEGTPRGAAVMVHGLTDAPFSMRHLAELWRDAGFLVVVPRMPGHGTTPGGLSATQWEAWAAATRLGVRAARARVPEGPLHLVGYSNGGALVVDHALNALRDPALGAADRIVLLSPMIGITRFAALSGIAGWPAVLPAFDRAAWFDIIPEFNPFKYNSFPVQAGVQSHRVTEVVRDGLRAAERNGDLARLPPIVAFQSVVDSTVLAGALVSELFARVPENGSVLVLFDLNRAATLAPLIRASARARLEEILPAPPRRYEVAVVGNAGPDDYAAVADVTAAGGTDVARSALGVDYPRDVFSLSHVALPFPFTDGLYGMTPDPEDRFGIRLGTLAAHGETGVIVPGPDMFARLTSNPFYDLMAARIRALLEPSP
jgi:alpha-beta hydrolase superfamily lysophospholipase